MQTEASGFEASSFAASIRSVRAERGWSVAEVARRTGLSRAYVNALERGKSKRPGADTIRRLEEVLGPVLADRQTISSTLPSGLAALAKTRGLSRAEVQILAGLRIRGNQPQSEKRWGFIYDALVASESLDDLADGGDA